MSDKKKKRRVFLEVDLLETSVVGIGAYPDAHYSLLKALSGDSSLSERRETAMEETTKQEEVPEKAPEEVVEEKPEEATAEKPAEEVPAEEPAPEKMLDYVALSKAVATAVKEALQPERGLVDKGAELKDKMKKADLGELALACLNKR